MEQKSDDISMQDAMRLAQSDAGKQLLSFLRTSNAGALEEAARQASAGDYQTLKQTLSDALSSPQAQTLLEQLRRQMNG